MKWNSTTFLSTLVGSMGYDFYTHHFQTLNMVIIDVIIGIVITLFLESEIPNKIFRTLLKIKL